MLPNFNRLIKKMAGFELLETWLADADAMDRHSGREIERFERNRLDFGATRYGEYGIAPLCAIGNRLDNFCDGALRTVG